MKNLILIPILILLSCANKVTPENQSNSNEMDAQTADFTQMTIVESKNKSCEFLLKDDKENLFEVENISAKIKTIKVGNKIWIKYNALRKMSVCDAQPISIEEIFEGKNN